MMTCRDSYDVLVAGAGPSGAVCATLLARTGLRVLLFDNHSNHSRPSEVAGPDVLRLLRKLSIPLPDGCYANKCRGVLSVWSSLKEDFYDYELYACEPAVSVNRQPYDSLLRDCARKAGVEILPHVRRIRTEFDCDLWHVFLDEKRNAVNVRFLIDATGRSGTFMPPETSGRYFHDRLIACVTEVISTRQDRDVLYLEAVMNGWWYFCHNFDDHFSLVYLTDTDIFRGGRHYRTDCLHESFESSILIRHRVSCTPQFDMHCAMDARSSRRNNFCGLGWVAIGDAAFTSDPLSGQGVLFAVRSAELAASAVFSFLEMGDANELSTFARWCEEQWSEQRTMSVYTYSKVRASLHIGSFWSRRLMA